jgi:hypothetical protein
MTDRTSFDDYDYSDKMDANNDHSHGGPENLPPIGQDRDSADEFVDDAPRWKPDYEQYR